jgi:hypothetical protein
VKVTLLVIVPAMDVHSMDIEGELCDDLVYSLGPVRANGSCSSCTQPTACSIIWKP